jgi:transposase
MAFYCGIDLSARDCSLCVIDDQQVIVLEQKLPNDLGRIRQALEPYNNDAPLPVVVESTFNWYWLVDGLQSLGFDVCLAHTLGLQMITGAKVKTDRRDAYTLAKLLRVGVIPKAYIYPAETRPVRDLLRRRLQLVRRRAQEYSGLRHLLLREGILEHSRNQIKEVEEEDLARWFEHPFVKLHASQELERIRLDGEQLDELEAQILRQAKAQPAFKRLQSLPGVGVILALTILYEVGEVGRFASARRFSSYCRLVPGVAQSGAVTRRGRQSKQGNPYLKHAFCQAAVCAVRCYPQIRRCFERQLKGHRGSGRKLVAYDIIAHKLALAAYHILRDGAEYRPELLFGR